jgi:ferritin-like metal-binding protein YciE
LPNSAEVICQYLQDAIVAERAFAERLRSFATDGDDEEVQLAFADHAAATDLQLQRLTHRLEELGGGGTASKSAAESFVDLAASFGRTDSLEARLVQNLITAFCMETGECAMYEALAQVAGAAGDESTASLAREIQREERRAADKIFHFLPTRSKIAFNVSTAGEIDPAIETKVGIS